MLSDSGCLKNFHKNTTLFMRDLLVTKYNSEMQKEKKIGSKSSWLISLLRAEQYSHSFSGRVCNVALTGFGRKSWATKVSLPFPFTSSFSSFKKTDHLVWCLGASCSVSNRKSKRGGRVTLPKPWGPNRERVRPVSL